MHSPRSYHLLFQIISSESSPEPIVDKKLDKTVLSRESAFHVRFTKGIELMKKHPDFVPGNVFHCKGCNS